MIKQNLFPILFDRILEGYQCVVICPKRKTISENKKKKKKSSTPCAHIHE